MGDLDRIQKLIIYSLCRATSGGKKAHVPKPYFMGRPELRGHRADKALRELVALNYIIRHPTSGGETFALDERGLEMCRKLREQMKASSARFIWYVFNYSLQFREFAYTHLCRIHNNGNEADLSSLDDPIMD